MNYTFRYHLPIYSHDKELLACINEDFCIQEVKNYYQGTFLGYNLTVYSNGEYYLLETYESSVDCMLARKKLEKAFNNKVDEFYIEEIN